MSNKDNTEVTVNMVLGLIINYILTLLLFGVTKEFAVGTSLVFFSSSWIRSRLVRKWFRDNENKNKTNM